MKKDNLGLQGKRLYCSRLQKNQNKLSGFKDKHTLIASKFYASSETKSQSNSDLSKDRISSNDVPKIK